MTKNKKDPRLARLGERIKISRENAAIGVNELARKAGLSASTISRLENGHGLIGLDGFLRLCDALNMRPDAALRQ